MIFDEPTASLSDKESIQLFDIVDQLRANGICIIYITHRLKEIHRLADRVTVLRDGNWIATVPVKGATDKSLVELMTGREVGALFPKINFSPEKELLKLTTLSAVDRSFEDVSVSVRSGEVVGIAGLVGSGKSEVGRACFGLVPCSKGEIHLHGKVELQASTHKNISTRSMIRKGLYYTPSDRRNEGLCVNHSVKANIAISFTGSGWKFSGKVFLRPAGEEEAVKEISEKLRLEPYDIHKTVNEFSGGNQQKVMLSKSLVRDVDVFIFDEPTVGVDVGARVMIYGLIKELCEAGAAILLISSDLPEILHLCNRGYVMHQGKISAEMAEEQMTEEFVFGHFFQN